MRTGEDVTKAIISGAARQRELGGNAVPATNEVERRLVELWEHVLGTTGIGIDDDYAALGGNSLAAVSLFAEIAREFGVKLPLTTILSSPTIRKLAREITGQIATVAPILELKPGAGRNLFLVHDGDGETLLYANLARRLPRDVGVFGINPQSMPNIPLANTRIEDMAAGYIQKIQEAQPDGPYLLGGMCAGGLIAYEMASQLLAKGNQVELVLILDAATPQAQRKPYLATRQRMARASQLFKSDANDDLSKGRKTSDLLATVSRKAWNVLSWETSRRLAKLTVAARFRVLEFLLKRRAPWPTMLPALTFRQIYQCAEAAYAPKELTGPEIVLVRATAGEAGDTPYVDLFADSTLGWNGLVPDLRITDVKGGHYSMLQEPYAEQLAQIIRKALPRSTSAASTQTADVQA